MDSDQGKLFVGVISWETTEETLKDYFGQFGDVYQANIMRDKATGRPRGFGFVLFSDPSVIDRVVQDKHTIDGRPVCSSSFSAFFFFFCWLFLIHFNGYFLFLVQMFFCNFKFINMLMFILYINYFFILECITKGL